MSTTAVLEWAYHQYDGDLVRAIDGLEFERAKSARDVLINKSRKHPMATRFYFRHDGFVIVE